MKSEEEVLDVIRSAGFSTITCKNIDLNLAARYSDFVAQLSKRRYLTVASSRAAEAASGGGAPTEPSPSRFFFFWP